MSRKSTSRTTIAVTRRDFIGAQMSNLLYNIQQDKNISLPIRTRALELQTKWDELAVLSINNPITAIELEKKLFKAKGAV